MSILSNNHVIADVKEAQIGDPILQPGPFDGGVSADQIATLAEFKSLNTRGGNNVMDAAIALTSVVEVGTATHPDGYETSSSTTVPAVIGMPLQKYGRTTGLTRGTVDAINVEIVVCYETVFELCSLEANFVNQITVRGLASTPDFSQRGDSGSLVVTDSSALNPVGLLFTSNNVLAYVNPIDPILAEFGVTIDGAGSPPPPPPPSGVQLYVAVSPGASPGGTTLANEDIAAFDGSDVGLGGFAIDVFAITGPSEILLSFSAVGSVPGLGTVDDSDIVRFSASSLGTTTSGIFSRHFNGSDVWLTRNGEDVDELELLPNGNLLVSTSGRVRVPGVSGADDDLIQFNPSSLGSSTLGSWSMYFDGSDIGLNNSNSEDIDAVAIQDGGIYLSTRGSFSAPGSTGADEDVSEFLPTSLGGGTAGSFATPRTLDGSTVGLGSTDVVAIDLP